MKERWRVIKEVKASGNSGSVYVPREWIGQSVEIRLYNAEEIVLEALLPYAESIMGIYLYGPHARGMGSPEEDIDVLVIAEKELEIADIDGVNCTVIAKEMVTEYIRSNPAEYVSMVSEAVPLMNGRLLEELRAYPLDDSVAERFYESLGRTISIARSLAGEGDYSTAVYSLILRLKDYCVLSSGGRYSYGALEEYVARKGIDKGKFACLYEVYNKKRHEREPDYKPTGSDIAALLKVLEELSGKRNEVSVDRYIMQGGRAATDEPVLDGEITKEYILEKARRYRERLGGPQ